MSTVNLVAQRLFEVFRQIVPPPAEWKSTHKKGKARAEDLAPSLARFHKQAKELRKKHRLGVISRARVVFALQREMNAAGYPAEMSRQVLFSLIVSAFVGKD
ncbi:MAG TPA: hypothetical protein VJ001_06505 [Rhodocyclaceae bacterium]|nr:hypothetical protein [Rhodocyclaceae bacterium]